MAVWNDPDNADLREVRDLPNVLEPGDVVSVMDRRPRIETGAVDRRHTFHLKGVPSVLRVRLLNAEVPRQALQCTVHAKGLTISGTTDADGWLEMFLMPDVREGTLKIEDTGEEMPFTIGTIRIPKTVAGAQTRLRNLGFYAGEPTGELDSDTVDSILRFQLDSGVPRTGQLDAATRAALEELHGS